MRKKHLIEKRVAKLIIILMSLSIFVSCSVKENLTKNESTIISYEMPAINVDGISTQIKRSLMNDGGYRFANTEYIKQISPFSTYYIREAKIYAGLISDNEPIEMMPFLLKKLEEDEGTFDLTDIFCTVMLNNDINNISKVAKENISKYFNSIYDKKNGNYSLVKDSNKDSYMLEDIYSTFLVKKISKLLNIETKPVDKWLKKVVEELLQFNNISSSNSSAYVMVLELLQLHDIEIEKYLFDPIIEMFEKDLEDISSLEENNNIYLPVYLMDYLDLSLLLESDTSKYNNKIINSLCDENGIKGGVILQYDSFGLYATIRTLYMCGYDFKNYSNINIIFDMFDAFLLDESSYINPGYVESNFEDTYFVDSIIHALNIEGISDISIYCEKKMNDILLFNSIEMYYFLELLQRNNLLGIINEKKQEVTDILLSSLEYMLDETILVKEKLPYINSAIGALEILEEDWTIDESYIDVMIKEYRDSDNLQENTISIAELAKFINSINPNRNEIKKLCDKIVENIVTLNKQDLINSLYVQSKSIGTLIDCDYSIPDNVILSVKDTLNKAKHSSGMFKGGGNYEDIISFRTTYDALFLLDIINVK